MSGWEEIGEHSWEAKFGMITAAVAQSPADCNRWHLYCNSIPLGAIAESQTPANEVLKLANSKLWRLLQDAAGAIPDSGI